VKEHTMDLPKAIAEGKRKELLKKDDGMLIVVVEK